MFNFIKEKKKYLMAASILLVFGLLKINHVIDCSWGWGLLTILIPYTKVTVTLEEN